MTEPNAYESPGTVDPAPLDPASAAALSDDERLWAMLAHLAALLGYVTTVGQYVAPLVIYFVYKDKSRFVAFHALQSLFFQLAVLAVALAIAAIGLATCGFGFFLAIPLGVVLAIGALAYVIVAAIKAFNGEWFQYWLIGDFVRKQIGV